MEVSTPSAWLSELEMEDLMLFQDPYLANSLDEIMNQNLNNNLTSLNMNHQDKHQRHMSLSSSTESNSNITTHPTTTTATTTKTVTTKPKPTKKQRIQNSTSNFPVILNFGSTLLPKEKDDNLQVVMQTEEVLPKENVLYGNFDDVIGEEPPRKRKYNKRTAPTSTREHIMAERRRREKLSQRFAALSALIPGLSRMDKTSILAEAIRHLKEQQEKIKYLEEQTANRSVESVMLVKKTQFAAFEDDDHASSCNEYLHSTSQRHEQMPDIEAKLSNKNILIKMTCEKHDIFLSRVLGAIEKHHLTVSTVNASPFGDRTLDVTIIAQMEKEFDIRLRDILEDVSLACRKC